MDRRDTALLALSLLLMSASCSHRQNSRSEEQEGLETTIRSCIGLTFQECLDKLRLGKIKLKAFVDEPPLMLRGMSFGFESGEDVMILIDERDPLFKDINHERSWNYEQLLMAKVGGIDYIAANRGMHIVLGNIPWHWGKQEKD